MKKIYFWIESYGEYTINIFRLELPKNKFRKAKEKKAQSILKNRMSDRQAEFNF